MLSFIKAGTLYRCTCKPERRDDRRPHTLTSSASEGRNHYALGEKKERETELNTFTVTLKTLDINVYLVEMA